MFRIKDKEKAPIYTLGSPEPRSFSRGKRGIAGTLVFTVFDRDALIDAMQDHIKREKTFHRIGNDNVNEFSRISIDEWDKQMTDLAVSGTDSGSSDAAAQNASTITKNISNAATPEYDDEVPPFNITISFANEYGQKAVVVIYAVEILNESTGFSIDNVVSEKACTFVARRVGFMKPVDRSDTLTEKSGPSEK